LVGGGYDLLAGRADQNLRGHVDAAILAGEDPLEAALLDRAVRPEYDRISSGIF
jgi:hypothetical protein